MTTPQWIDITDRKPPIGKRVILLTISRNGTFFIGKGVFHGRVYEWTDDRFHGYRATCVKAWMDEGSAPSNPVAF